MNKGRETIQLSFEPLTSEETGKKLYKLRRSNLKFSIEEEAMYRALSDFLQTGNLKEALEFFDSNDDPKKEKEFGLNGRRALKAALEEMQIPIPEEI